MLRITQSVGIGTIILSAATAAPLVGQRVADLQVIPESVSLGVGERRELLATAYGQGGDVVSNVTFNWAVGDSAVVRVDVDPADPAGMFYLVGLGQGSTTVTVRVGSLRSQVAVEVSGGLMAGPQGTGVAAVLRIEPQQLFLFPLEDVQLRPVFLKEDGSLAAYSPLTWRSFRPDVAEVDQSGKVIGIAAGIGAIEATTQTGLQARIQVQVATSAWAFAVPVFALSPLQSDTVHVVVTGQNNRRVENRWFMWATSDPDVVTVSPLGVATAISAGRAEIGANGFGQELRLPVTVHREVEFLRVRPTLSDTVVVPLGGTREVRALPEAADETLVLDAPVHWVIGDTTVLSYSVEDTLARGRKIGATTLTARAAGGNEVIWNVKVVAAGLAVDRARMGMSLDAQVTLQAFFSDSTGEPLSPATDVTWTSTNETVARVNPAGTVTPIAYGRSQIVAGTPWDVADTATVLVQGEILVTSTRNGTADIFAFDRATPTAFSAVTDRPGDELGPAYSPDGSRIVYAGNGDGSFEIYVVDADGQHSQRLTTTTANETEPAWTPDGEQIVYQSDVDGSLQVWIMNADGSNQRALTMGTAANFEPSVSPDGTQIAFTSVRDGNYEIYLMNMDGSDQRNVTRSAGMNEKSSAWLGDGTVVYVREERVDRSATWVVVRQELDGEAQTLTQPTLVVTDFAISPTGEVLAVTTESPGPTGGVARRLFLIPLDGETPIEVPRAGEHDQLVRPAFRP